MFLLIVALVVAIALASFFAGQLWKRDRITREECSGEEYIWTRGEWTFRAPSYDALINMITMFQPDAFHQGGGEEESKNG